MVMDIEKKIPLRIGFPAEIQQATRVDVPLQQPAAASVPSSSAPLVPFAPAIPVPSNTMEAPIATASESAIVLGGVSTTYGSNNMAASSMDLHVEDLVPLPPPQVPSLQLLLEEMTASVNDSDIISDKLNSPDWRPVITGMSSADYGAVVAHVSHGLPSHQCACGVSPGDAFLAELTLTIIISYTIR